MFKNHSICKRCFRFIGVISIFLILFQSCIKDFPSQVNTDYVWEPVLAFPIGEADFGLRIPHGFDTLLLELDPITGYPYWDFLDSVKLRGSIEFDFNEVLGDREEINYGTLRFNAYNGFPIEIEIQAYLIDVYGNIIDSLFNPTMILARGKQSGGGETEEAVLTQRDIYFDALRLDILQESTKITFKGEVKTIPFFDKYSFRVQLAAKLGMSTQLW
ncbi:MAG: hypothetical protein PF450_12055 [Bacteroidales bacterium]|jgi:hypothetical protein|nr:hypothetical protein [Bacteroidales bacterium]